MGGGRAPPPPPLPPPLPPPPPPPPLAPAPRRSAKPAKAPPRTCQGTTKQGLPCRIAWRLDALGFCKYHTQLTRECRGVARSTGKQCRIRWDLDANGYCQYHTSQAPAVANSVSGQCVAVARSTGQRCRITIGLDANGLCNVHQRTINRSSMSSSSMSTSSVSSSRPLPRRVCQGTVHHTGMRCMNDAKPHYDYCCAAHDPALPYFSPRLFDASDKPRSLLEPQVVRLYNGHDLYHGDLLDLVTPGVIELDHIFEKQCFAFAFHGISFSDAVNDAPFLASIVRDECANDLANVCLTRTTTNKIKGAAVWKFLDDTITGHVHRNSLTDYMLQEKRDDERLQRLTTRVISREMGRALKTCQYKLADQGESPLLDALSQQLQRVYVAMDLHSAVSSSHSSLATTKFDCAAKPRDTRATISDDERRERVGKSKLAATIDAKPFVPAQGDGAHREGRREVEAKCSSRGATADTSVEGHRVRDVETESSIEISAADIPNFIPEAKSVASVDTTVLSASPDLSIVPLTESSLESDVAHAPVESTAIDEPTPVQSTTAAESDAREQEVERGVCPPDPISREDEGTCDKTPPHLEGSHSSASS